MSVVREPTVFIAYPPEFKCYSKYERKVKNFLSSMHSFNVIYLDDYCNFIDKIFHNDSRVGDVQRLSDEDQVEVRSTHAIFFDDGQNFRELSTHMKNFGKTIRRVKITLTRVVNIDRAEDCDEYIGRGTDWGNPYAIGHDGDREEVVRKFKYDFDRDFLRGGSQLKVKLKSLAGKRLGCHCKPAPCHGDVLAEYLNALDDGL